MKIAVIGGGATGLAAAYFLAKKGAKVCLFEKNEVGGLMGTFRINSTYLEKYYHHFFKSDRELIALANELGLNEKLYFKKVDMGFYHKNRLHRFSTPLDLLSFRPLRIIERIKTGLLLVYFQKTTKWKKFEKHLMHEWLAEKIGRNAFDVMWLPLMTAKFGNRYKEIPLSWFWGRIHPRANSRSFSKEELGYIKGSCKTLTDRLQEEIKKMGAVIIKKEVKSVSKSLDVYAGKKYSFDKVLVTTPTPAFTKIANLPKEYADKLGKISYQGIVCMALKLKKPLSGFYWLNISDPEIAFGGVIEHTNFIPKEAYGASVAYLFNYAQKNSRIYRMSRKQLFRLYMKGLKKIYSSFNEKDVESYTIFRDEYATPVYTKDYLQIMPPHTTPIKNLYLANTAQIYPEDRNINNSIKTAKKAAAIMLN